MTADKPRVTVREVGLRDGLQSLADVVPTRAKVAWLQAEAQAGVREFEVTSFVPPALVPQLADAKPLTEIARLLPGVVVAALVPNAKGAARAIEAGVHKIVFVLSASDAHNAANVRRTLVQSVDEFRQVAELVKAAGGPLLVGGISTAFGCTLGGEVPARDVRRLADVLASAGADELTIADTVGFANPRQVKNLFAALRGDLGLVPLAAHFHDTRGLGLANVCAALEAGVTAFDASLGGLGGCPHAPGASGNVVTEDLVFMLEEMGLSTGIDLDKLLAARRVMSRGLPSVPLHGAFAVAGRPRVLQAR